MVVQAQLAPAVGVPHELNSLAREEDFSVFRRLAHAYMGRPAVADLMVRRGVANERYREASIENVKMWFAPWPLKFDGGEVVESVTVGIRYQ